MSHLLVAMVETVTNL